MGAVSMSEPSADHDAGETPGQKAHRLIREAEVALADPSKSEYHERLRAAIDAMERELDFWAQIAAINRVVDIANERVTPPAETAVERCRRLHGLEPGYVMGCDECERVTPPGGGDR